MRQAVGAAPPRTGRDASLSSSGEPADELDAETSSKEQHLELPTSEGGPMLLSRVIGIDEGLGHCELALAAAALRPVPGGGSAAGKRTQAPCLERAHAAVTRAAVTAAYPTEASQLLRVALADERDALEDELERDGGLGDYGRCDASTLFFMLEDESCRLECIVRPAQARKLLGLGDADAAALSAALRRGGKRPFGAPPRVEALQEQLEARVVAALRRLLDPCSRLDCALVYCPLSGHYELVHTELLPSGKSPSGEVGAPNNGAPGTEAPGTGAGCPRASLLVQLSS
jgi:hypothetical protein